MVEAGLTLGDTGGHRLLEEKITPVSSLSPAPNSAMVWGNFFSFFGPQYLLLYNKGLDYVVLESTCS